MILPGGRLLTDEEREHVRDGTLTDIERARIMRRIRSIPLEEIANAIVDKAEAAGVSVLELLTRFAV